MLLATLIGSILQRNRLSIWCLSFRSASWNNWLQIFTFANLFINIFFLYAHVMRSLLIAFKSLVLIESDLNLLDFAAINLKIDEVFILILNQMRQGHWNANLFTITIYRLTASHDLLGKIKPLLWIIIMITQKLRTCLESTRPYVLLKLGRWLELMYKFFLCFFFRYYIADVDKLALEFSNIEVRLRINVHYLRLGKGRVAITIAVELVTGIF